jgi:hypothetical protein
MPTVHVALPEPLSSAAAEELLVAGVEHVAHGDGDPVGAAVAAVESGAVALLGPFRSAHVAEAVEATAPAGLALLAPVATWAGVTRDDEPAGPDEPADLPRDRPAPGRPRHGGGRAAGRGRPQLGRAGARRGRRARLRPPGRRPAPARGPPRAADASGADLVVLCGLTGEPEIDETRAAAASARGGVRRRAGADLGAGRDVRLALPFAPLDGAPFDHLVFGAEQARRSARLVTDALGSGARDRGEVLAALRAGRGFDEHGDPIGPPVWLWRAEAGWTLRADRPAVARRPSRAARRPAPGVGHPARGGHRHLEQLGLVQVTGALDFMSVLGQAQGVADQR